MAHSPLWRRSIEQNLAINDTDNTAVYCQLATVDAQGKPQVRTMVYRGFDELDHGLMMCTDFDSEKCQQLDHQSAAQVAWYLSKARIQYRLSGTMAVFSATTASSGKHDQSSKLRSDIWRKLSMNAKKSFIENSISQDSEFAILAQGGDNEIELPNNFSVIKLVPVLVELLDLNASPHHRSRWSLSDSGWSE